MARDLHRLELGVEITGLNGASGPRIIQGSAAPGGDGDIQDGAAVGSIYLRTSGEVYKKTGTANSAADWVTLGDVTIDELKWRNEKVIAATVDTVSAGSVDVTGFSDNESGLDGNDFSAGDYLIGDADGSPALFEVTAITSATDITVAAASQAIAENDTFVVQNYLPDSGASQEGQAIVHSPDGSSALIKIGDVNWDFATGINLSSGYTAGNGTLSSSDTVESAIEKLDGNQQDLQSLSGVAQGSTVLGAFSSPASLLMAATYTVKSAFQRVGDLLAQLRGVQATGITTEATVDSVPVASVKACKWLVEAFEEAIPANREAFEVFALNDGSTGVDDTLYSKLKVGSGFNLSVSVDIDSGNMRLRAASTSGGVTVTARRIEVVKNVL